MSSYICHPEHVGIHLFLLKVVIVDIGQCFVLYWFSSICFLSGRVVMGLFGKTVPKTAGMITYMTENL